MKQILQQISANLSESTYLRIAFIYRYELNKLEERKVIDPQSSSLTQTNNGDFNDLTDRLLVHLIERLENSPQLVQRIDNIYNNTDINFATWANFIDKIKIQRRELANTV